jgi:hypothetical protein
MRSAGVYIIILFASAAAMAQSDSVSHITSVEVIYPGLPPLQNFSYSAADSQKIASLLTFAHKEKYQNLPIGKRIVKIGEQLLGIPYEDKTLENNATEKVVCYLGGLDCVTFFENAWAMARTIKHYPKPTVIKFAAELQNLRYRNGRLEGYGSRLHYTTDYFFNNAERGHLEEMTKKIGGKYAVLESKPIDFMSTHPNSYRQITRNDEEFKRIEFAEREIASRGGFYYIPKESVALIEKGIEDGDLIGITTSIKGIDCSHTGIAVRKNGRIHLMHASLTMKKVIISDEPLADYLAKNSKQTGIVIYRPKDVEKRMTDIEEQQLHGDDSK